MNIWRMKENSWKLRQEEIIIFTNPSARAGYDTRSIFKRSLTGLNSGFSFSQTSCLTKAEEPSLSYYLPIAGERIIGFIPFPRALVLCEMQSVSSRIWSRVAVSTSCDDNHYTTGTSNEEEIMWEKPSGKMFGRFWMNFNAHNVEKKKNKTTAKINVRFMGRMGQLCLCYIITERFFYINHFSLIIVYHSVWLGFELFDY